MSAYKSVLVLGSSGNIGSFVTRALLDAKKEGKFTRIAAGTSNPDKPFFTELAKQGLEVITIPALDDESKTEEFKAIFKGFDAIVSTIGDKFFTQQGRLARAAAEVGVKRFLPSEFGTDVNHFPDQHFFAGKIVARKEIEAIAKEFPDFSYTYVITNLFADMFFTAFEALMGISFKNNTLTVPGDGTARVSMTSNENVGAFTTEILLNPEQTKNTSVEVESYQTSYNDIAAALERVTGKKFEKTYVPIEKFTHLSPEAAGGDYHLYLHDLFAYGMAAGKFHSKETHNSLFPSVKTVTLDETIKKALALQK